MAYSIHNSSRCQLIIDRSLTNSILSFVLDFGDHLAMDFVENSKVFIMRFMSNVLAQVKVLVTSYSF